MVGAPVTRFAVNCIGEGSILFYGFTHDQAVIINRILRENSRMWLLTRRLTTGDETRRLGLFLGCESDAPYPGEGVPRFGYEQVLLSPQHPRDLAIVKGFVERHAAPSDPGLPHLLLRSIHPFLTVANNRYILTATVCHPS